MPELGAVDIHGNLSERHDNKYNLAGIRKHNCNMLEAPANEPHKGGPVNHSLSSLKDVRVSEDAPHLRKRCFLCDAISKVTVLSRCYP